MSIVDVTLRAKIQNRVSELVKANMDDEGFVSFDFIAEKIIAEFSETAIEEAKKQYDFMYAW
jgi:hypothetical protein